MGIPIRIQTAVAALIFTGSLSLSAPDLRGQESTTRGFNLGVHLQGASLAVEDQEGESGGGLGIRVGYGLNRIVTLYFEADGISVDSSNPEEFQGDWTLAHADLGARFHFANTLRSWVPYLDVAIGGRAASVENAEADDVDVGTIKFNGGAFSLGGGLSVYLKENLALDMGLKASFGTFNEIEIGALAIRDLDIEATSTRFKVGLLWWKQ
jgi:hypothetical protein